MLFGYYDQPTYQRRRKRYYIISKLCFCDHVLLHKQHTPLLQFKLLPHKNHTGSSEFKEAKLSTLHTVHRMAVFTASSHKYYVILTHDCYVDSCLPSCEKNHVHYVTCKIIFSMPTKQKGNGSVLRCQAGF